MLPPSVTRLLLLLPLLLVVAASVVDSVPLHFSLCGPDNLGIRAIQINQWPVRPGSNLIITADYTPRVNVTGGTARATVHLLGFPVTETRDVCREPGITCPILGNEPTTSVIRDRVPALTPSLAVDVKVAIADQQGRPLTCVMTHVDIQSRPLISPLAQQLLDAMEQYLRFRPSSSRDTPLLRGGGGKRRD